MDRKKKSDGIELVSSIQDGGSSFTAFANRELNIWQGAALLTADCLGTGILALPRDIKILGRGLGVGFLLLNLPINLYAGTLLSNAAGYVERQHDESSEESEQKSHDEMGKLTASSNVLIETTYDSIQHENEPTPRRGERADHDTATFDFIGMTSILFHEKHATVIVMILFYTNIFLVLGNYILVMSHAVSSIFGGMCIPKAGLIASILMFAVSQLRTMAKLGRSASIISLLALFVVVLQCLYYVNQDWSPDKAPLHDEGSDESTLLRKMSAMGSIGFAVGSQKLFLNIRHEIADRDSAPKSLALSLSSFGTFYVAIVLSAGSNPPGFLFDAIPTGYCQRIGGFFLWIHVVVSYAINSQAICSSMDRIFFHKWQPVTSLSDDARWMVLSGIMAMSAFVVANSIPFFKDLVALIGALTSVPLTLLLPAVFHRKIVGVPIWMPSINSLLSYALVAFSVLFISTALVGSVHSIISDWEYHTGGFFSCDQ